MAKKYLCAYVKVMDGGTEDLKPIPYVVLTFDVAYPVPKHRYTTATNKLGVPVQSTDDMTLTTVNILDVFGTVRTHIVGYGKAKVQCRYDWEKHEYDWYATSRYPRKMMLFRPEQV